MLPRLVLAVAAAASLAACRAPGASSASGGATPGDGTGGNGTGGNGTGGDGAGNGGDGTGVDGGAASAGCGQAAPTAADDTWTLASGGLMRTVHVHVPSGYDPTRPTPLVLDFHGYTSNAMQQELLSNILAKADAAGFIAVHPEGTGSSPSWNAGACCGEAAADGVDDVGLVRDILDHAEATLCVDVHRVYATGMSNGGFLSHRLGCELADRIAAVAPVAGVLGVPTCAPSRPVPVMHFHGTADGLVPYDGNPSMGFPSVPDTFAGWAQRDQCRGAPTETFRMNDAHCSSYLDCAGGAEVTLCTVDNGGHTWPGGTPVPALGYTTPYLSATDAMWSFFQAHPLP